jgi:hypothetical protein
MPTKKIADPPPPPCRHPDHKPPSHQVFQPGSYQHVCPRCGQTTPFVVHRTQLSASRCSNEASTSRRSIRVRR